MLEFKKCNDENLWHEFVIDSPQGSIFCQPSFLKAKKMKYATYFVEKNGNKLLGCILILNTLGAPTHSLVTDLTI